jgi:glycosyltransferase involved in cell wall biosynthesis
MSRVDIHVHTKYSCHPTNFFLKKLKAPESMTAPEAAYKMAKERGMDFVTLTDSNSIEGCLEIAHHGDVFNACETPVVFPEDDCTIRLLVLGLTERQLEAMLKYRGHIYDVRDYLLSENLYHVVSSPLEIFNPRFNPDHIEKMLLLFDHFETRNGSRHARTNEFITSVLDHLSPEFMEELQKKWQIQPASEKPWQKGFVGGSSDYCGQYIGLTWTEVPQVTSPQEFLEALRRRAGTPAGDYGSTIASAHSMYRIAFQYYQKNLRRKNVQEPDLVSVMLSRVLQPGHTEKLSLKERMLLTWGIMKKMLGIGKKSTPLERRLQREFFKAYNEIPAAERLSNIPKDDLVNFDERLYHLADRIISKVSYRMANMAAAEFGRGHIENALGLGAAVIPLQGTLGPYLYCFEKTNRDRPLIEDLHSRLAPALGLPPAHKERKRIAWFSDTINDVNGVSHTLHKFAAVAEEIDADLTIISSVAKEKAPQGSRFLNFEPIGEISIPDYELQKLSVPPLLEMLRYLEQSGFTEYVISTPGPVGLVAMLAARLFHVPTRAIYHSDFPEHVRHITGDEGLHDTTWSYMRWFYGLSDVVYSPSDFYRRQLIDHDFNPDRLFIFTRGTDLEFYNPKHRDESFFASWGVRDRVKCIYVGRVSREKNLDIMLDAFMGDAMLLEKAALIIVGDGPYLEELKQRYIHPAIVFTGFMKGNPLSQAYASADIFLFPSTTDTYGNSVLEAQAAGLPAIVSDEGGPKEIISTGESGLAISGHDLKAWRNAMRDLVTDSEKRHRMAAAARARTATRDWVTAFKEFWDDNPYPSNRPLQSQKTIPFL